MGTVTIPIERFEKLVAREALLKQLSEYAFGTDRKYLDDATVRAIIGGAFEGEYDVVRTETIYSDDVGKISEAIAFKEAQDATHA